MVAGSPGSQPWLISWKRGRGPFDPWGIKVGVSVSEHRTIPGTQEMSQGLRGFAEQALATSKRLEGNNLQQTAPFQRR